MPNLLFFVVFSPKGYVAPAKIDPKLLDPKHIFKEVEPEEKRKISIQQIEVKRKRQSNVKLSIIIVKLPTLLSVYVTGYVTVFWVFWSSVLAWCAVSVVQA